MVLRFERITYLLRKRGEEPFYFASPGRLIVEYAILLVLLAVALATGALQEIEGRHRMKCNPLWVSSIITAVATYAVNLFVYIIAEKLRFYNIFPHKKLDFSFERIVADGDSGTCIPYSRFCLLPTVRALRETVEQVKDGEKPLLTVTSFLRSAKGKAFLRRVLKRLRRVKLLDGELVRICHRNAYYFTLVTQTCLHLSVASGFRETRESCDSLLVFMKAINYFSLTLIAIFALASFAGIGEYAQLISVSVKKMPLSEDEKFMVSLVAANSSDPFFVIARSESSGYANIMNSGEQEVFVPMHMSLFAYKEAKAAGTGRIRHYMEEQGDCVGNFDMI